MRQRREYGCCLRCGRKARPDMSDDHNRDVAAPTAMVPAELVRLRSRLDAGEARWLQLVAEFDRREGWRAEGQLSGVDWLVCRCGMGRSTAKERLRVPMSFDADRR